MSGAMSGQQGRAEERQTLLSEGAARESEDERPPPSIPPQLPPQLPPQPSLQSIPLHHHPLAQPQEAPPAYELPTYSEIKPAGIPVQLQVDGQTVTATLIQEPHGKHMVYIGDRGPGVGQNQPPPPPPPKDYLGLALLGLLCCCFPLGVVALLRSIEVHRLYRSGDYIGALRASKQAQSWGMAAVMFGLCIFVLPVIMRIYFLHSYHHVNVHYGNQHYYNDY